jgi:hypothetical protein
LRRIPAQISDANFKSSAPAWKALQAVCLCAQIRVIEEFAGAGEKVVPCELPDDANSDTTTR